MRVNFLPNAESLDLWPKLLDMLRPAAEVGGIEPWEMGDLVWIAHEGGIVFAVMTTRIDPDGHAEISCLAGTRMSEWLEEWTAIVEQWATNCGAPMIECRGRKGWGRYAKRFGWETIGTDDKGLPVFGKRLHATLKPALANIVQKRSNDNQRCA